jgi:transcriptional regulator with XRE-family HTH domain
MRSGIFPVESYPGAHIMRGMNALSHIRKRVFQLNQIEFAAAIGVAQSTVSRWENGIAPSLDDMQAIRAAARVRGIDWDDRWFFDVPVAGADGEKQPAA